MFEALTVTENLELALACEGRARCVMRATLFSRTTSTDVDRIDEILKIGSILARGRTDLAWLGLLSHGQKQWLEIGMLLAQNSKLLLH